MTRRLSRNVDAFGDAGASACKPERRHARGLAGRESMQAMTFAVTMSLTES